MSHIFIPRFSICFISAAIIAGCSTTAPIKPELLTDKNQQLFEPRDIDEVLTAAETFHQNEVPPEEQETNENEITTTIRSGIPVELNANVEKWIKYFTEKDRARFIRFMERGGQYKAMITEVLRNEGMPTDLYYLAMIESGFSTRATSRASAVGVWQFIRATGKRYGLRVDRYVDERRDPHRATVAAALYLKDLHNVFQSWYLAIAAYNAGEMRILGAIMSGDTRDFWTLVKNKKLPRETMNYIPKFLAAVIIGSNPEKYGLAEVIPKKPITFNSAKVPTAVRLKEIATTANTSVSMLKKLNPHLNKNMTPPGGKLYRLWVPEESKELIKTNTKLLASKRIKSLRSWSDKKSHRVRRGENLALIAAKYRTTVRSIMKINGLTSSKIYPGKKLLLRSSVKSTSSSSFKRYRVRRGDSLDSISRKFGTTIRKLKRMNRLKRNTIYAGQLLKIKPNRG
ncbi:MAG: lytic transglycosylase [Zetaproteobacteria bacterium]|nr:lytic transglycosylase [Pseudobdellovibrionaceae bacterium]|tara:strand:- start:263 stop:1627 length:1365 start_codon:yes stop_codon:yes gene_type:complete